MQRSETTSLLGLFVENFDWLACTAQDILTSAGNPNTLAAPRTHWRAKKLHQIILLDKLASVQAVTLPAC